MGHVNAIRTASGVRFGWYVQDESEPDILEILPEEPDELEDEDDDFFEITASKPAPVRQYTLEGVFVCEYPTAAIAAKAVGSRTCNVTRACRGLAKSSGGYIFRYADDLPPKPIEQTAAQKAYYAKCRQLVEQLDMDGNVIARYKSQREAADAIGGKPANMSLALSGAMMTYKGYKWRKVCKT